MNATRVAVAVAGGGPAGSALARRLALLGHEVVLIERDPHARDGVVESLSRGVGVHLATLGVDPPSGRVCPQRIVRWRGETEPVDDGSLLVDRGAFDAHLLRAAADAGVRVLHATVTAAAHHDGRWILNAGDTTIEADFLADTTGRAGLLRRARRYAQPRTFALRSRHSAVDDDAMHIDVHPDGWTWSIRDHSIRFIDRDDVGELAAPGSHFCDATPYVVDEPVSADFILAGDAACAIDPLSSSGVQAALGSAVTASIAANTILRAPERTRAAIDFYSAHVQRSAARHAEWRAAHYASADARGSFWRARTITPHPPSAPSPLAGEKGLEGSVRREPSPLVRGEGARRADEGLFSPEVTALALTPPNLSPDAPITINASAALIDGPVVAGDLIEMRRILRTPAGEHVAYVGGIDVAPLVASFRDGMSAADLAGSWPLAPREAIGVLRWLVANEVVERHA